MKNVPRVYIGEEIQAGLKIPATKDITHYLLRVMRRNDFLGFGAGKEFKATLSNDGKTIEVGDKTEHKDPSNDITLMFSPIKRTDDLLNMATQMGVSAFQPVITERTVAQHINWGRMKKIIIEAAEQSNRNSVPKILPEKKFKEIDLSGVVFADERAAYGINLPTNICGRKIVFVGPEGGFSDAEFNAFDASDAIGISLGKTILRAELAAVVAISRVLI